MALNLSTLTNPATSGGILAEALTTADLLDPVPILKNLSRGSNKGGDAKQTTGLNQPRALPLIKNPSGDLGGYLYIPNVSGNYAEGPSVTIGSNETWEGELDMVITQWGNYIMPMGGGDWALGFGILFYNNGFVNTLSKAGPVGYGDTGITLGTPFNVKYGFNGTDIYADIDGVRKFTETASSQAASITHTLELNQQTLTNVGNYAIQKAKLTVNSAVVFDCDFNGSTSIRHGDTKFNCVGGPVVLTKAGNDPVTVVKKSVLRFANQSDGSTTIGLDGLFSQEFNGGYMFAALSVLGDGGGSYGYVFATNKTGGDSGSNGGVVLSYRHALDNNLGAYRGALLRHYDLFDDSNGDILHEHKATNAASLSKVNNADEVTLGNTYVIESDEFKIGKAPTTTNHAAFDLEYLALFPASITDAEADRVRDFINNRNNVFSLIDSQGYYFFDPQKATFTGNFTGANTLGGYITGSDLGDTDVRSNLTLEQSTLNDQPSTDGYTITFNDAAEHLEFENAASQTLAGWQICGTSLGTFVYRVQGAVTELNLLGNLGSASYRQAGDLYGIILLPESATGADIEAARKLLIDRGAADGASSVVGVFWYSRTDIVNFNNVDLSGVTQANYAWNTCTALTSFDVPMPSLTSAVETWRNCYALKSFSTQLPSLISAAGAWTFNNNLSDFRTTDIKNCTNFTGAWQGTTALTSFPAGAKLGTSAQNVDFQDAWRSSGLTSFSTPLPTATNTSNAWLSCHSLASFNTPLPLSTNVSYAWFDCPSLTSFDTLLPLVTNAHSGWYNCTSLTAFDTPMPLVSHAYRAWGNCSSLTDFSADVFANWNPASINSGVFDIAWDGCTALTAQSVENILTSIDASGKYATSTGASGGSALADAGIDIDYNVATGSLSAATNSAIDSLSGKGWEVFINGVLVIPNILDLEPAAAYSLRSFDADADPNVVKVRRSSDGALSDFKASEVTDGTLTDWVGAGNDGHVTTWYDQGGTNHAAQSDDAKQPKIVDGGTLVTEGGKPALDFDGADDHLFTNSAYPTSNNQASFIAASSTGNNQRLVDTRGTGSSGTLIGWQMKFSNGSDVDSNDSGSAAISTINVVRTGHNLISSIGSLTSLESFSNGTLSATSTGSLTTFNSGNALYIAANVNGANSQIYGGFVQEMIFFNTDQSANRTGIENNINDHFDIYS